MRPRELCRQIERLGGVHVGTDGSHRKYVVDRGVGRRCRTAVPIHTRELRPGLLRKIERDLEPALGKRWLRG